MNYFQNVEKSKSKKKKKKKRKNFFKIKNFFFRIIMGLNKFTKTPCGFCFVEYCTSQSAQNCMKYINQTKLDDRIIRTELDPGFTEGRQFGRGKTGGQVIQIFFNSFSQI